MLTTMLLALAALQAAPTPFSSGDPVLDLWTYGTAAAGTFVLGAVKKYTTLADTALGKAIKPVQPWVVMALSFALPRLIHGTPNTPDATALATAPVATLLAVGVAEIFRRFTPPRIG